MAPRRAGGGPPPLSFAQQRLWFLYRLDPEAPTYNIARAFRLSGPLDPTALAGALAALARRHETLRTAFPAADGRPVQRIEPEPAIGLPVVDLSALPGGGVDSIREREATRLRRAEARRPFRLERAPLARAFLLRLSGAERGSVERGGGEHVLLLTLHHAIADGWSMAILFRELSALYRAAAGGAQAPPASLPPLPVQYADFAAGQRERLTGAPLTALVGYWRGRLAGAPPVVELPTDRPRPPFQTADGRRRSRPLPAAAGRRAPPARRAAAARRRSWSGSPPSPPCSGGPPAAKTWWWARRSPAVPPPRWRD